MNELFVFDLKRFLFQVFFNYIDVPKLSSFRSSTPVEDETASLLSDSLRSRNEESKLGFNMCECGFEGISIKVAKRSSNQVEDEALEEQVTKRAIFVGGGIKSINFLVLVSLLWWLQVLKNQSLNLSSPRNYHWCSTPS